MADFQSVDNGFRLKGIWWDSQSFSAALDKVLGLHQAISNHRIAFHFGITEKAIRRLRARSSLADQLIAHAESEAAKRSGKPVRYAEWMRSWELPEKHEARLLVQEAEDEKERQDRIRYLRAARESAAIRRRAKERRAQRHSIVQSCKLGGMTQAETAWHISLSLSTVKRYWPEVLPPLPRRKKRSKVSQKSDDKLLRHIMRQYDLGKISALKAVRLIESEGIPVPASMLTLARHELEMSARGAK